MSVNLSEQELYRMFREQLPSIGIPIDLTALLQNRLLAEVAQTLAPSGGIHTAKATSTIRLTLSRLFRFVRNFQLILPALLMGVGAGVLLTGVFYLLDKAPVGELNVKIAPDENSALIMLSATPVVIIPTTKTVIYEKLPTAVPLNSANASPTVLWADCNADTGSQVERASLL